jgi:serine/threonine-protein kinase
MAVVVRAVPRKGGADVALKISRATGDPFYPNALKSEGEILRKLNHQGVVKVLAIDAEIDTPVYYERATELKDSPWYFVMEYLRGGSLRDLLKSVGPLTCGEACAIAQQVALALQYVHSMGYAHNDVKTDNILFRERLQKKSPFNSVLIDFGIAAKLKRVREDAGALLWMSPERLRYIKGGLAPEYNIDSSKVDVYAVGVLLYKMLTNKMPFNGISESSITSRIINQMPDNVRKLQSTVPPVLDDLILACMAKKPEARPTAAQLANSLNQFTENSWVTMPKKGFRKP